MSTTTPGRLTDPVGDRDHVDGTATASVSLVEYGDFECSYCWAAHPVVRKLRDRFGPSLRFVFRHFPLASSYPHTQRAAEAAEAAGAQGKFWPMYDLLFENREALEDSDLVGYATSLGLDIERFSRELESHEHAARVRTDLASGARSGVDGTPTFFIGGEKYEGANDFESLLAALESGSATPER